MKGEKSVLKRRRLVLLIIVLAVAGILAAGAGRKPPSGQGSEPSGGGRTEYAVRAGTTQETIEVSGNVEARDSVDLGFARDGRIKSILVDEGDRVAKGQILAELDYSAQTYTIASTASAIDKAKISGSARDLADLQLKKAAEIEALAAYRIISTINGRVSDVEGAPGEVYEVGKASASYVIRVIDDSELVSEVEVDEIDAPKLKIGQRVAFSFDALPSLAVAGRVKVLPIEGTVNASGIAKVKTRIEVLNPPEELLAGYSFTAEIVVKEGEAILVLDERGVAEEGGTFSVALADAGGPIRTKNIAAEKRGDGTVRVLSGLAEGDVVLGAADAAGAKDGKVKNPLELLGLKAPEGGPSGSQGSSAGAP